ncbi:MAG: glycerate kinase [Clostridiales bacterium]|jgi:glycerate kinase|nr:glycerate kinase [Clostridiales bacterium]
MRVLIAMDSFKGTLRSLEVAAIVEKGVRRVYPLAGVEKIAIADGGEGTTASIVGGSGRGEYIDVTVSGPMGHPTRARYGIIHNNTAVIEMAEASGLHLVSEYQQNPLAASSYGTGQLIQDALGRECKKIIIGIGGSATNDGGMGMAAALGAEFLDSEGNRLEANGGALDKIVVIKTTKMNPAVGKTEFLVACDVANPLYGKTGASVVFGPQKGAKPQDIELLDNGLKHYAEIIKTNLGIDIADVPGAGAAGGLGAGLMVFCGATMAKGIDIVLDTINIEEKIKAADIIITGEGRVDGQTIYGKAPVGVAARAKKFGKPVFAIAGFCGDGANLVYQHGIDAVLSAVTRPASLEEIIADSPLLIEEAAERLFRIIRAVAPCAK